MGRFLKVFGVAKIEALLADREFVGEDWFRWLQSQGIPFRQRLRRNTLVPNGWNRMMRLDTLFGSLKPGDCRHLPGRRPVCGGFVHITAPRLDDGDFLFIASAGAPQAEAIDAYADRWQICWMDFVYSERSSSSVAQAGCAWPFLIFTNCQCKLPEKQASARMRA